MTPWRHPKLILLKSVLLASPTRSLRTPQDNMHVPGGSCNQESLLFWTPPIPFMPEKYGRIPEENAMLHNPGPSPSQSPPTQSKFPHALATPVATCHSLPRTGPVGSPIAYHCISLLLTFSGMFLHSALIATLAIRTITATQCFPERGFVGYARETRSGIFVVSVMALFDIVEPYKNLRCRLFQRETYRQFRASLSRSQLSALSYLFTLPLAPSCC